MKRVVSFLLAVSMLFALCVTPVWADTWRISDWYAAPTSPGWNGYDMTWSWSGTEDDYFKGFEVALYYCDSDSETPPDAESVWYSVGTRVFCDAPGLADFEVDESGWYRFAVCAYGEEDILLDSGYWTTRELTSPYSNWSGAVWFETKAAVASPTNLRWVGTSMVWDVDSVENIDHFDVQPSYMTVDSNGDEYEDWITTGYVEAKSGQTTYSLDLCEMVDEEWLVENRSQTYYFKVQAVSQDVTVAASTDWVTGTAEMKFNAEATKLDPPTNVKWDGYTMTWDFVEGLSYDVYLYYLRDLTEAEKAEIEASGGTVSEETRTPWLAEEYWNISSEAEFPVLNNDVMYSNAGNYSFTVRTRSNDLSQYLSSDWSEASDNLHMDGLFCLPVPTKLGYDTATGAITWDWEATDAQAAVLMQFEIQLYYRANANEEAEQIAWLQSESATSSTDWKSRADKDGLYSFMVKAVSSDYTVFDHSDWSALGGEFYYDAPDPLPAPSNLAWVGSVATWSALSEQAQYVNRYYVSLYYCGTDGSDQKYVWGRSVSPNSTSYAVSETDFAKYGAGVYQFKVRAESNDATVVSNGEWATSGTFTYTPAETKLATPTNPHWDGQTMKWDLPDDRSNIAYYEIDFYVPGSSSSSGSEVDVGEFWTLDQWYMERMGDTIYFRVRAISNNVNVYGDSAWAVCESTYEKPAMLATPTDLVWSDSTMTWSWGGDASQLAYFLASLYYAESETDEPKWVASIWSDDAQIDLNDWGQYVVDSGVYYFQVRAYSRDTSVIGHSSMSTMSAGYTYAMPERLAAPTNVAWNGSVATWTASTDEANGLVEAYKVVLYKSNGDMIWSSHCYDRTGRCVIRSEVFAQCGAGNYTFGVQAISANAAQRSNSLIVTGDTFAYSVPSETLSAPANVRWDGLTMKWDAVTDGSVAAYELRYYSAENENGYYSTILEVGRYLAASEWMINRFGENINFKVRALSSNAGTAGDSDWAVCTETYTEPDPLPVPTDLTWSEGTLSWSWSGSADLLRNYYVHMYYAETAEDEPVLLESLYCKTMSVSYNEWMQYACGKGVYYFSVQAYSSNTSSAGHSAESERVSCEVTLDCVGAPTNLQMNGTTITWDGVPGVQYKVWLYKKNASGNYGRYFWSGTYCVGGVAEFSFESSTFEMLGNGTYRMGVIAVSSDYTVACNSVQVMGEEFTYTNPGVKLDTPTNLRWDGATMKWDMPEDTGAIDYYYVHVFVPGNENRGWSWNVEPGDSFPAISMSTIEDLGKTLTFSVRAVTKNANVSSDSAVAYCETNYVYSEPEQIDSPSNLAYDRTANTLTWDAVDNADYYSVKVYYAETKDGEQALVREMMSQSNSAHYEMVDCGYFTFVVQACSFSGFSENSEETKYCYDFILDLPALDAPTELNWGRHYDWGLDENGNWVYTYTHVPGVVSWKTSGKNQACYRIRVYKVGQEAPYSEATYGLPGVGCTDVYMNAIDLMTMDLPSGTYYFTVQAIGDKVNYCNSVVAKSEEWTYVNPGVKLNTPTDPHWDGSTMCWSADVEEDDCHGIQAFLYYSKTLDGERSVVCGIISHQYDTEMTLSSWHLEKGSGYYWFEVRILSGNKNKALNSEYSVMSPAYYHPETADSVSNSLAEILPDITVTEDYQATEADVKAVSDAVDAVRDMDNRNLANAMAVEQTESNTVLEMIETLETQLAATGGAASEVDVDESMKGTFDTTGVSVVGAALNADEETETVSLTIGAPSEEVPKLNEALYTSAVQFSMHLEDEKGDKITTDGGELAVPVHITLPVPANINPAFLVVLHYHADGTYEEIHPTVYKEDDQWFASFVVTSFSDFALAAVTIEAEVVTGGVEVNVDLAVGMDGSAMCAVYNKDGKQLGVDALELTAGEHTLTIECDADEAAVVKLFVLDTNGVPTYVESTCQLKSN